MVRNAKGVKEDRQKQVALHYFLHDLSVKEIAKKLGWTEQIIYRDIQTLESNVSRDLESDKIFEKIMQPFREMYKIASEEMARATLLKKDVWLTKMHAIHSSMVEQLFKKGVLREAPKQLEVKNYEIKILYERKEGVNANKPIQTTRVPTPVPQQPE